ncbi:thioredoxin [Hylemonella gracilis str. Niagara R]|uniref:Thioredoxin n=2 Tax=Hylemonella gracilis TaxID=80880 RepID=A0A016XKM4_9BURK|nr:thioredoxin [Hylemonella gracilis str. Niagara R]
MFKVAQDQLKVSQGWVRCGQCEQVFDATVHLVQEPPALTTPLATPPSGVGSTPPMGSALGASAPQKSWDEEMVEAEFGDLAARHDAPLDDLQLETPDASAWREPRFTEEPEVLPPPRAAASPRLDVGGFPAPSGHSPRYAAAAMAAPRAEADQASLPDSPDAEDAQALSFMRRSRWRHPAVRALLVLLCCVLSMALLLQVAHHERDRLAAREPALRPWLQVMCEQLDCTVEPLRQIESVVIDGSAFSKIRDELYQLNLTLRNKAAVDLALPAVELVLTDVQDQVLIRRVLLPQELGMGSNAAQDEGLRTQGTSRLIRSGSEFQATVLMEIKNGNGGANRAAAPGLEGRVAGYRLLAFYP